MLQHSPQILMLEPPRDHKPGKRLLEEQTAASKLQALRLLIDEGDESPDVENFSMENIKKKLDQR